MFSNYLQDHAEAASMPERSFRWLHILGAIVTLGIVIGCVSLARADPMQSLGADWQALATQQAHVQDDLQQLVQAFQAQQKHAADLDAYLKACGDKPGCTQPAEAPDAPAAAK